MTEPQSPFHRGEQNVQARLGVRDEMESLGRRIIRDHMPDAHRSFFNQLPFVLVGSVDEQAMPWASLLVGRPGFITSTDPQTLHVDAQAAAGDPLLRNLANGAPIAFLGIELQTRRRNRVNGKAANVATTAFDVHVDQSFGNCPKYIQSREPRFQTPDAPADTGPIHTEGSSLSDRATRIIQGADTFFIATVSKAGDEADPSLGADVSHRGGKPGFVSVVEHEGETRLTFPDFVGNFLFNTLGNIEVHPFAGLLFIDFDNGDVLSLTGGATVIWGGRAVEGFVGAERLLQMRVQQGVWLTSANALRFSPPQLSPHLRHTGDWK